MHIINNRPGGDTARLAAAVLALAVSVPIPASADAENTASSNLATESTRDRERGIRLTEVKWEAGDGELVVKGRYAGRRATVTVSNADTGEVIASFQANREGSFERKLEGVSPVPCRVRAESSRGSAERDAYSG